MRGKRVKQLRKELLAGIKESGETKMTANLWRNYKRSYVRSK